MVELLSCEDVMLLFVLYMVVISIFEFGTIGTGNSWESGSVIWHV